MNPIYMFQTSRRIVSGNESLKQLNAHLGIFKSIKHALILTIPNFDHHVATLTSQLDASNISYTIFTGIQPEPTIDHIEGVYEELFEEPFDVIIGMGGGSILDAAKLLSVLSTNKMGLKDMLGTELIPNKGIPMVLIPTTSGTGSEVTPNAIVTLPEEELKIGVVSRYLLADLVVLDPSLTLGLPPRITAATGMDAFTHSFESYISNKANPISDMIAMESMRLISGSIIKAYEEGSNLKAREDMILGSMYGGMALTAAGTAAVHAMAYPLGGKFNIPHGEANSMLLPHVTRANLDSIEGRMAQIAREIGLASSHPEAGEEELAEILITQIEDWTKRLNIPQDLSDFGVTEADLPALAEAASKVTRLMDNNPKVLSVKAIEEIYRKLLP